MTGRKDPQKALPEKYYQFINELLRDDDNKYCADCDAKGPRWASCNLGIFLCIRCAGIHRNMGVHISRVRSVNLDAWNLEQLVMLYEVGNSRGRAIYEANLPDDFRRPHTDAALDQFIRAKYDTKRYIAREWVCPKPNLEALRERIFQIGGGGSSKKSLHGIGGMVTSHSMPQIPQPPKSTARPQASHGKLNNALDTAARAGSTTARPTIGRTSAKEENLLDFTSTTSNDAKANTTTTGPSADPFSLEILSEIFQNDAKVSFNAPSTNSEWPTEFQGATSTKNKSQECGTKWKEDIMALFNQQPSYAPQNAIGAGRGIDSLNWPTEQLNNAGYPTYSPNFGMFTGGSQMPPYQGQTHPTSMAFPQQPAVSGMGFGVPTENTQLNPVFPFAVQQQQQQQQMQPPMQIGVSAASQQAYLQQIQQKLLVLQNNTVDKQIDLTQPAIIPTNQIWQ